MDQSVETSTDQPLEVISQYSVETRFLKPHHMINDQPTTCTSNPRSTLNSAGAFK
ncbi:hypothetical protein LEMLEM_LOCUS13751 [Lemmus lemmus]